VFRPRERWLGVVLVGLAITPLLVPASLLGAPIMTLSADEAASLSALNVAGIAMLLGLIALRFMRVFAATGPAAPPAAGPAPPPAG